MNLQFISNNFSTAASGLVDKVEAEAGKRILAKYPDINDVLELLKEMFKSNVTEQFYRPTFTFSPSYHFI